MALGSLPPCCKPTSSAISAWASHLEFFIPEMQKLGPKVVSMSCGPPGCGTNLNGSNGPSPNNIPSLHLAHYMQKLSPSNSPAIS